MTHSLPYNGQKSEELNTEPANGKEPLEDEEKTVRIDVIPVPSSQNILHLEAPRYPEKCKRWKDIPELTHKRALETLLKQGKTPAAVAEYLNCSPQQVYRAMKAHNISTARAYSPALLEQKLNLGNEKKPPPKIAQAGQKNPLNCPLALFFQTSQTSVHKTVKTTMFLYNI